MIVSHGFCPDGLVSAHLACKKYPDAIVHFTTERNMRLDKYFPDVRGARLLILDYCYPFEVLQELASSALSVCVYDHHKTAIEDINSRITSTHEIEHICQTVLDEKTKVHFTLRNLEVLIDTQFCASEIVSNPGKVAVPLPLTFKVNSKSDISIKSVPFIILTVRSLAKKAK